MLTLPEFLLLGFLIGLTGALAPGPTLVATITSSVKNGWTSGPKIASGHIVIEAGICILIICGLAAFAGTYTTAIGFIGGIALVIFGIMTIRNSRNISIAAGDHNIVGNPYLAGGLTSISNPYFWIWWLTVGSSFLLDGLKSGIIFAVVFMLGHWAADIGWFTFVSLSVHRGRSILSERTYPHILALCGFFLVIFGTYYILAMCTCTGFPA